MIFCARATRGRRLPSLDARSGRSISPHPQRDNERAWEEEGSDQMPFLLAEQGKGWEDTHIGPVLPERAPSEGPRSTAAVEIVQAVGAVVIDRIAFFKWDFLIFMRPTCFSVGA
jgi:hypothetical protein